MKRGLWLIIATVFLILGSGIFVIVMSVNSWDFTKIGGHNYQTNTHEITMDFNDISIDTDTADIVFCASNDEMCKVVCYEVEKAKHSVEVKEGTLIVKVVDERKFYDKIFGFGRTSLTIYLPKTAYQTLSIKDSTGDITVHKELSFQTTEIQTTTGDVKYYANTATSLKIKTTTGDIRVESITAGLVGLTVSTGEIDVNDISCAEFTSEGSTGDIELENVLVTATLSIVRDTGDVEFTACDAGEIVIETDTGDVEGTLLSDKIFITETDTGRIDVPKTTTGGRCQITTDTGDIKIKIVNA
ncbi:MAG: DUF4097 domain-containing protein [Clostridiales bacterium]|nr:DUF4097 domain-containing protein [Clostridiales bacterium]